MPEFKMPNETPTIDFDDLHFPDAGFNYQIAADIAVILMDNCCVDDLRGFNNLEGKWEWPSSIGTGGGWDMPCPTQSAQRACLAAHLSSWSRRKYTSCLLSIREYQCIKDLLNYLKDECFPPNHRIKHYEQEIELLSNFCHEFEQNYLKVDKKFLFTIIKEAAE